MTRRMHFAAAVAALSLSLAACGRDTTEESAGTVDTAAPVVAAEPVAPEAVPVIIGVSEKAGAAFLTDGSGRALYVASTPCTATDCGGFMPLKGTGMSGDAKVDSTLIGVTTLPDGTSQITYAGQPLFTHIDDTMPGDTKGSGKAVSGTTYRLAKPSATKK